MRIYCSEKLIPLLVSYFLKKFVIFLFQIQNFFFKRNNGVVHFADVF